MTPRIIRRPKEQAEALASTPRARGPGPIPNPSQCRVCAAFYRDGRWHAGDPKRDTQRAFTGPRVQRIICPACKRIDARQPAGELLIGGTMVLNRRAEILEVVRRESARLYDHDPVDRIMEVNDSGLQITVTTTGTSLPDRLARVLVRRFGGTYVAQSAPDGRAVAYWRR